MIVNLEFVLKYAAGEAAVTDNYMQFNVETLSIFKLSQIGEPQGKKGGPLALSTTTCWYETQSNVTKSTRVSICITLHPIRPSPRMPASQCDAGVS